MFYDNFLALCKQKNVAPSAVMRAIGLNKSSATYWKKGSIPSSDTLQKLADYFSVTVDFLLGEYGRGYKKGFELGVYGTDREIYGELMIKGYTFSSQEEQIIAALSKLNLNGQQKAAERVEELTEIPRYRATPSQEPQEAPPQRRDGTDTTPPPDGSEGPPE